MDGKGTGNRPAMEREGGDPGRQLLEKKEALETATRMVEKATDRINRQKETIDRLMAERGVDRAELIRLRERILDLEDQLRIATGR
jgi:uncharacterized membrane protein